VKPVPILIAAVVLVTLLGLLNLLLMLAVIRRLREHTTQLAGLAAGGDPQSNLLADGAPLPAFSGRTTGGAVVANTPTAPRLIAFLSTTCDACHEQVPELARYLSDSGMARDDALVVVVGATDSSGPLLAEELDPLATIVREPSGGPIGGAFGVRVFPTFYLVDGGVVRSAAIAVRHLAEPVAA
jgi:hypothetical protein